MAISTKGADCLKNTARGRSTFALSLSLCVLAVLFIAALCIGRYGLSPLACVQALFAKLGFGGQVLSAEIENVIFKVRLPRILAALLVGGALAVSGTVYQGIFKNPLVSPDLLGVSAGASVGAAVMVLLGTAAFAMQVGAFVGGILSVLLTIMVARLMRNHSTMILVLSGIIVQGFMSALIGVLKYVADPESELAEITYWQMGSLANTTADRVFTVAPAILLAAILLFLLRWQINLLSLGDAEAASLGVNVKQMRGLAVAAATVLTASSVCVSGIVGWVGLIIPHMCRLMVGADNTVSVPLSFLVGANFMLLIDTLARSLISSEIPLSILTGFVGAPLYAWLLMRQRLEVK